MIGQAGDEEQVVLLDDAGRPVGARSKILVHGSDTAFHLAFSAYVFDRDDQLLVTRRALGKQAWAGVWSNSCCGHPGPGEDLLAAVHRRLQEELGLAASLTRLVLPHYRYRTMSPEGIVENEFCPVFVCRTEDEPVPAPAEVIEYRWVPWATFRSLAKSTPWALSPWAVEQSALFDGPSALNHP